MTKLIDLLALGHTGHVLAAFTRVARGEGEIQSSAVAGAGFPLRRPSVSPPISVPAAELVVTSVPFNASLLLAPQAWSVKPSDSGGPPVITALAPASNQNPSVATQSPGTVDVTVAQAVTEDTPAVIFFEGTSGEGSAVVPVTIAEGDTVGSQPHGLDPGTYDVVLLVAGLELVERPVPVVVA